VPRIHIAKRLKDLYRSRWYFSLILIFSVLVIYMFLEIRNNRFWLHDFEVYCRAADRVISGENLYRGDIDGFYKFKYSPVCAVLYIPFTVIPLWAAKVVYWLFLSAVICACFYLSLLLTKPGFRQEPPSGVNSTMLLAALILGVHMERELHLGQVNQILLLCYLATAYFISKGRDMAASIILAAGIFIKPFGLIFVPYLIFKRRFRPAILFLLFTLILAAVPNLFYGPEQLQGQYDRWFHEITTELSAKQDLFGNGNHTLFSILARFTPLRLVDFTPRTALLYQATVLIALAGCLLFLLKRKVNGIALEFAILTGLIPLLTFTSYNAFGFLDLAVFLVLFQFKYLTALPKAAAILGFVYLGMNIYDLLGHRIWTFINDISLVSIGALLILMVVVVLRISKVA